MKGYETIIDLGIGIKISSIIEICFGSKIFKQEKSIVLKDIHYNQKIPFFVALSATLICVVFGANIVAIKISLAGLGPFTSLGFRFMIGTFPILLWAKITGRPLGVKKGQIHILLIISIIFTLQLGLLNLGLARTNASRGTLLFNFQPFFVLLLAHFFIPGDKISKKKILGLSMGFSGVVLVFLGKEGVTSDVQFGDFMVLITAFLWACNTIYIKRIINTFEPFHLALYPMMFSVPFFFLAGFMWDGQMVTCINLKIIISILYQSLLASSLGLVAWNYLLLKYGAVSLHSFLFIMPIAGVLLGGFILREPITLNILFALLLIVSGILFVNYKKRKHA